MFPASVFRSLLLCSLFWSFFFFALSYSLCSSFFVFFFLLVFSFSRSHFFVSLPCVFFVSSSGFLSSRYPLFVLWFSLCLLVFSLPCFSLPFLLRVPVFLFFPLVFFCSLVCSLLPPFILLLCSYL